MRAQSFRSTALLSRTFLATVLALQAAGTALAATPRVAPVDALGRRIESLSLRDFRGREYSLAEFPPGPLVVAFVGVDCPLVKLYLPRLVELSQKYRAQGVSFVAVDANQQDSITELAALARQYNLEFPLLKDADQAVMQEFGAERTPQVFVLDAGRTVRYAGRIDDQYGFTATNQNYQLPEPKRRDLAEALDELTAGREISQPLTESPGCRIARRREAPAAAEVNYAEHVAAILDRHCVSCHQPGQIAPFPLTSYEETVGWSEMIVEVTQLRRMPPWHAAPGVGHFKNTARLTDDELAVLEKWAQAGAPAGDLSRRPAPPVFAQGWMIPEPDQVVAMADKPYDVPAEGIVEYQNFFVDPGWTEDKWIRAIEPRPGNRSVVHHILVFVKKPKGVVGGPSGRLSNEFLAAYAPGFRPEVLSEDQGRFVPAGSQLIFQMHYTPTGAPQQDLSTMGIAFADPAKIKQEVLVQSAANYSFRIPPGEANYEVTGEYTFGRNSVLRSLMPHAHLRGKDFQIEALFPDGARELLLDIPHYDFGWQTSYQLTEPKPMPAGTKLLVRAHYDNSSDNLNNPDPTIEVTFGEQTFEEMMIGFFEMSLADQDLTRSPTEAGSRLSEFAVIHKSNGGKLADDMLMAASGALHAQTDDYFHFLTMRLGEVLPQLDRACITYVEDGKLRLWRLHEMHDFKGAFRSPATRLSAKGQALAEFAVASGPTVVQDIKSAAGSIMRQMAGREVKSSLHLPIEVDGRRGTLNLWSTDAQAFPPEAVEVVQRVTQKLGAADPRDIIGRHGAEEPRERTDEDDES